MTPKSQRIADAMSAPIPDPPEAPPPTDAPKKRSPVPSPEFVQARLRRDIRLLDERMASLLETFAEKKEKIAYERARLAHELKAVDERLAKAGEGAQ